MKIVIDVPASLFDRLSHAVAAGGFASIGQFATVALENQLSLEGHHPTAPFMAPTPVEDVPSRSPVPTPANGDFDLRLPPSDTIDTLVLESAPAVRLSVEQHGWIWGIVNRVFPIKVVARSLLLDSAHGPVPLEVARTRAADRAHALATWLSARYGTEPPGREESLLTGLPTREPAFRAKERFADHYFGRVDKSRRLWGAMFELGLASTVASSDEPLVALTSQGLRFASLPNPVLDAALLHEPLSSDEIDSYVDLVVLRVSREGSCFSALLEALAAREMSTGDITEVARRSLPGILSTAAVQTMKTGALGRMHDLKLTARVQTGRLARFGVTQRGESVLARVKGAHVTGSLSGNCGEGR